jgi:radical SAM protein with 4Fe4S-binding SPASM domain
MAGEDLLNREENRFKEYRKKWKEWPQNFHVGEFPLFIDIEATNACNLKCPFCVTTSRKGRIKNGLISFEIVKKIIDEGADNGLYGVKFNIRGEPLLHPQIHEFVRYAKKKRLIDIYFNTNAVLLTEEISKKLIEAGLGRISVSFEGYTKGVYEKYRVGASYEKVLLNIENLQTLKKKLRVKHPKVRIQTVMLADLELGFENYKKFWSERVEEVAFLDYKKMKEKKKGVCYPWACPQIYQRMGIFWDGTILPCNHDDDALLALGNIRDIQIREAWHCEQLNKIRDIHKIGCAHEIQACNGCYLRDSEILKLIKK